MSLSARRAWIEIVHEVFANLEGLSLSARRAWIEIFFIILPGRFGWSLSARRAWIEMRDCRRLLFCRYVALRKESVDRNSMSPIDVLTVSASLSARRAWIEITQCRL